MAPKASGPTEKLAPKPLPAKPKTPKPPKPPGPGRGRKKGDINRLEANKGYREKQALRNRRAFEMRCQGMTIQSIATALGVVPSTVHEGIEAVRDVLKSKTLDLAAQEREISLQQLDTTISRLMPFITSPNVRIETVKEGAKGPITVTVEAHDALVKSARTLAGLIDRKAKLLGLDAALKIEVPPPPPIPPAERMRQAQDVLKRWGAGFAPRAVVGGDVGDG